MDALHEVALEVHRLQCKGFSMSLSWQYLRSVARSFWIATILTGTLISTLPADQPNILVIYLDDFGWKDTGYMGSDFYETPNIDKLAQQGIIFSDAYSCAANCAPARACLLSGQYTPRHKIYNVGTKPRGKTEHRRLMHVPGVKTLDSGIKTWAHRLQDAGYKTATIGKWHLSDDPLPYGFDINVGGTHAGSPPKGYYPPHGKAPGLDDAPQDEYLTDRLNHEAIKFIENNKDNKWCLYLTHFAVHTPLQAKQELVNKYESKAKGKLHNHVAMATMIEAVDLGVGKIVETLERTNLRDNTVILFCSDNGGYGPATDMAPLKGYKGTYYEGGIRVPCFANWPGKIPGDRKSAEPITGVDLYPTICELGKASIEESQTLDGVSLVKLMTGAVDNLKPRALFWHFPAYLQSYGGKAKRRYNEQRDPLFRSRPCSIIRHGDWKLHQYFEQDELELYNLAKDIGESNNLAKREPEKTQALLKQLKEWQASTQAPAKFEKNPDFDSQAEAKAIKRRSGN